jgi:hypothetical protein
VQTCVLLLQNYSVGMMRLVNFWLSKSMQALGTEAVQLVSTLNDVFTATFMPQRFRARRRAEHQAQREQMRRMVSEVASHRSGGNRDRRGPEA